MAVDIVSPYSEPDAAALVCDLEANQSKVIFICGLTGECLSKGIDFVYIKQVCDFPLIYDGYDLTNELEIQTLMDYVLEHHYPAFKQASNPALALLQEVIQRTAEMIRLFLEAKRALHQQLLAQGETKGVERVQASYEKVGLTFWPGADKNTNG